MDSLELEEVDPWHPNLNKVTVNLKRGLDISMLTTGADLEFVSKDYGAAQIEEEEEINEKQLYYQKHVIEHLKPECADFCEEEKEEKSAVNDVTITPFSKMSLGMEDLTGDRKVLKKIIRPGVGSLVPDGAMVRVHYNGYLEYSDEPYDSSRLRNKEQEFKLGRGDVIAGWEVAIASMKKSELSRFLIHPSYAFGQLGCPPRIPPNVTIMFEIEVLSFVDVKVADDYEHYSTEKKEQASLDELISVANSIREEGNDFFHRSEFHKASIKYRKAVCILEDRRLKDEEEEKKWKMILVKLYLNQSLCNLKMKRPKPAITQCRNALNLDEKNVKATFRLGQAYMLLSEFDKSRKYLILAGKLSPGNTEIRQELGKLDKVVKKFKAVERTMYSKMFSSDAQPSINSYDSDDSGEDSISAGQLEEYRELYLEKFCMLNDKPHMMELMVPLPLCKQERACAEEIASGLGLLTEMVPDSGLRVYKKPTPELEEFMLNTFSR